MNKLDEIIKKLEEAEKQYQQKCQKYGIDYTIKKPKKKIDEEKKIKE